MIPTSSLLASLAFPVLLGAGLVLIVLAYRDLSFRRLPNAWVGAYAALFLVYAWSTGMAWEQLVWHGVIGVLAVMLTVSMFAIGAIGGGDVKLWGALMLWAGPQGAVTALVIATLCGSLLGLSGWLAQRVLQRRRKAPGFALLRMLSASRGVPYGVGLAIAGLHTLYAAAL
jgi:prepilin peptidase CpaA